MHILFVTENFPPETNAAAARVYERACYWVKWGHRVTVLTTAPNFPAGKVFEGYENRWFDRSELDGIEVLRVKTFIAANRGFALRTLDFLSFMTTGFVAGLLQEPPDVVVATSPQFFAAVGGWAIASAKRRPFIFELGDLWPASIRAVGAIKAETLLDAVEKLELFMYRKSAAVVALTPSFKKDLIRRGIPSEKISVVINGVDLPRYAPRPKDQELAARWGLSDKFIVGYIGTHGMAHALDNIVNAAILLRDQPDIALMLVGDGAERAALEARVKKERLENVVMVPRQPKNKMPNFWSLCDIALVHLKNNPVFSEVIPSKIFEAMAMGLPILLAAPEGEATKIVSQTKAGKCVAPEKPELLAKAILNLKNDQIGLERLAKASQKAAPEHSRERQAEAMIQVLTEAATEYTFESRGHG